ncbi:MAG: DUF1565 domain-containing protein [bacterium]|nr:DUF1565 domain-containing protein [bacterium]
MMPSPPRVALLSGLAVLFGAVAIPAQPVTDYWVDAVNGSDAFVGSRSQPFQSLAWAVTQNSGDVHIHVLPGVYSPSTTGDFYDSSLNAPRQLDLSNIQNIKITGADKATCILDFGAGNGVWGYIKIASGSVGVEISDLTMRNAGVDPWGNGAISVDTGAQDVDVHSCYFEQTYSTLIVWGGFDVAFHDNVIVDTVPNTGQWPSVGVRVRTNGTNGDRTSIYNNTFHALGQGISWSNDSNGPQQWIMNNVVVDSTARGFPNSVFAGSFIAFENNLAFNSAIWNYDPVIGPNGTAPVISSTNLEVDPMLASPSTGDFAPLPGSPCIESGSAMTHPFMMNDYAGNNRAVDSDENGSAIPDRGAIEATDLELIVTSFAQGQVAIIDPQTSSPGTWAIGALVMSFQTAPAYDPWWGMSGPNLLVSSQLIGIPGAPMGLQFPSGAWLDGVRFHMQFVGLKLPPSGAVLKCSGLYSNVL